MLEPTRLNFTGDESHNDEGGSPLRSAAEPASPQTVQARRTVDISAERADFDAAWRVSTAALEAARQMVPDARDQNGPPFSVCPHTRHIRHRSSPPPAARQSRA